MSGYIHVCIYACVLYIYKPTKMLCPNAFFISEDITVYTEVLVEEDFAL